MKKVIYTSIIGGFDELIQPKIIDPSFDYICFVEKGSNLKGCNGVWKFREIPFFSCNDRILSRFPKLLPHLILPDYYCSLWIDGNVGIRGGEIYNIINKKILNGILYSGLNHWSRDCSYDEAIACLNSGKESLLNILKTIAFLKSKKFPKHYGLYENNVIFRVHNNPLIINFDKLWWEMFMKYAKRDQICHSFCMREFMIYRDFLLPKDLCSRNYPGFVHNKHVAQSAHKNLLEKLKYDIVRKFNVSVAKLFAL